MSELNISAAGTGEQVPVSAQQRTVYSASGRRQATFALALLFVLPFTFGAMDMLLRRLFDGLWIDMPAVVIVTVGLLAVTCMLWLELLYSLRARVQFNRAAFAFTLPRNGGPTPFVRYVHEEVPYHAIKSVELRTEVFGGRLAPVLLRGLVVRTKDNREIVLGHSLDGYADPVIPYQEIGDRLAGRCALRMLDQRTIWRRTRRERAAGYISEYDTQGYVLDGAAAERLNTEHQRIVLGIASALAALVLLGLLADFASR